MTGKPQSVSYTRTVEVFWGDCDAAGIVFYPNYYAWFDASTHKLLESVGLSHRTLREQHGLLGLSLVHAEADFRSPARFGDLLTATATVARIGNRSLTVAHQITCDEREIAVGNEIRACIAAPSAEENGGLRAVALPAEIKVCLGAES